ncbi:MAG: MFS transporter [Acidimicrobiia bacterium]|nr:MFS transporter [Acidimicrobiia bacterium]
MEKLVTRAFGFAFTSNLLMGLTFALFIHYAGFLVSLGASEGTVGVIVGVGSIGSLVVRPYVGHLMDRIGRRPLIHAGNLINVAGLAALTTVTSISWWVYALTIVHGIAEAVLFTSFVTYTADIVPASRRTEGMALFGVSGQMPLALGGLLGDFILRTSNYTTLFWVAVGLGTAAFAMALPLHESKGVHTRPSLGFLVAIRQHELSPIWLITASFSLTLISIFTFLKTFVDTTGYGSVGVFFAAYSTMAIVVRLGGRQLPQRFGEIPVLSASLIIMSGGMVLLGSATTSLAIGIAGATAGIGHGFSFPILNSLVVERSTTEERGAALSGFLSFFPLASLIGAPLLGWVIESAGYTPMYRGIGAQLLLVVIGYALWERHRHHQALAVR